MGSAVDMTMPYCHAAGAMPGEGLPEVCSVAALQPAVG